MILDGRQVLDSTVIEYEVCVIGAGAAGISIAMAFLNSGHSVAVIESGGLEPDADTQDLYDGTTDGVPYPDTLFGSRLRFFGGTTNHWAAYCAPFKEADFVTKDWVPNSGWPISLSDLKPFYRKAFRLCRLGKRSDWNWDVEHWRERFVWSVNPFEGSKFEAHVAQVVANIFEIYPKSFGKAYGETLKNAPNIVVYLFSNAVELVLSENVRTLDYVRVACNTGSQFTVRAQNYVLATGGIETARILLASNRFASAGVGNEFDNVGRYFMDHIYVPNAGRFVPSGSIDAYRLFTPNDTAEGRVQCFLPVHVEVQKHEKLIDSYVMLFPQADEDYLAASESEGVQSAHELIDDISAGKFPDDLDVHIYNLAKDVDDIFLSLYRKVIYGAIPVDFFRCLVRIDPTPVANSRITLTDELDPLGMPRVNLNWAIDDSDKHAVHRTMELFASEVGRLGLGRVRITYDPQQPWTEDLQIGWHHMGTTRMSADERNGVVDMNCKVHGISNLFIAGSSVFSTSGSGTPTMTIVALALRLSDHIKEHLK